MKRLYTSLALFITVSSLFTVDYSLLGDVRIYGYADNNRTGLGTGAYFDHRFTYQDGAFGIMHELNYSPEDPESFEHNLYTAYADIRFSEQLLFTAGKFRIPWTKAVYFAALDKINPQLNGLDTNSPREGFWGTSFLYTPDFDTTVVLCADISEDAVNESYYNTPKIAAYYSRFFGNLDLFISGIYQHEKSGLAGVGFSYNLFDFIVYAEGGAEFLTDYVYPGESSYLSENDTDYLIDDLPLTASAGVEKIIYRDNYTLSFLGEYLFTEAGYTKKQTEDLYTLLFVMGLTPDGILPGLGRHHIVLNAGIEIIDRCVFDNAILINLSDSSVYQTHGITFIMLEDIDLNASLGLYHGDDRTELGFMSPDYTIDYKIVFHF